MIRSVVAALVLMAPIATPVAAQEMVPVGARVRVHLGEAQRQQEARFNRGLIIRGVITAESPESLWIKPTRVTGSVGIAKPGIRRLYQSRGVPTRFGSLLIEGTAGAVIGMLEVALVKSAFPHDVLFRDRTWGETLGFGAAYGGTVFGLVGFLWPMEYWRRIPLD